MKNSQPTNTSLQPVLSMSADPENQVPCLTKALEDQSDLKNLVADIQTYVVNTGVYIPEGGAIAPSKSVSLLLLS